MRATIAPWLPLIRPGDILTLGLGGTICIASAMLFWSNEIPDKVVIRAGGKIVAELPLDQQQTIDISGPIGISRIEVDQGRARVASDPGPHQYCVRQGWLDRVGAVAICAPNEVSLTLAGRNTIYDSLSY